MEYQNDLFIRTVNGEQTERPPIWLMRQAGRILPQYNALRAKAAGFKEMISNPEYAAEATIQPIDELGVDAAILFSDILVIPEAMGIDYTMIEKKGPSFPKTIQNKPDIENLVSGAEAANKLGHIYEAIQITLDRLDKRVPLIGFSGAPWTLMAYMIEGQGSKTFSKPRRWLYRDPENSHLLLQKLTDTIIAYLKMKVRAGVALIQIFDSWAGVLNKDLYATFCIPYLSQIVRALEGTPVTIFAKDAWFAMKDIQNTGAKVIGLDWAVDPKVARASLGGGQILQGNLDPCILYADGNTIESHTRDMIKSFGGHHIVNLGHGVYPDTPLEGVKHFINTVKNYHHNN